MADLGVKDTLVDDLDDHMQAQTAGFLVLLSNTKKSLQSEAERNRYIDESHNNRRGGMDGEGLKSLDNIIDIIFIQQSAEHTSLEIDHIFRLGDARVERLHMRVLKGLYSDVGEEVAQVEAGKLVNGIHDEESNTVITVQQMDQGVNTLGDQDRSLRSGIQEETSSSHDHTGVDRH